MPSFKYVHRDTATYFHAGTGKEKPPLKAWSHTPILIKEVRPEMFETRERLRSFGTIVTAKNDFSIRDLQQKTSKKLGMM